MKRLAMTAAALVLGCGAACAQDEGEFRRRMEDLQRNHERAMQEMNRKFQAEREKLEKEFKARLERKDRPAPPPGCDSDCPGCPRLDCPGRCPPAGCPKGKRPSMDREDPILCLGKAIHRLCALLERLERRMDGLQKKMPRLGREGLDRGKPPMFKQRQGGEGPRSAPRRQPNRDRRGF